MGRVDLPSVISGFNSRTRVGATSNPLLGRPDRKRFNSRTRVGATLGGVLLYIQKTFQFTHPCGCDSVVFDISPDKICFNSRTRVGATTFPGLAVNTRRFQFTHPCGCDPDFDEGVAAQMGFNSRTRVGATFLGSAWSVLSKVSIHAPVWVRQKPVFFLLPVRRFQFTHPCGCDAGLVFRHVGQQSFNSRTRVGATAGAATGAASGVVSIHAPVWVRRGPGVPDAFRLGVSIHAPVWVRRPDEYGLSIKHATKVLRQPDARTRCGQA